jgi:carbonic anhydrase
MKRLTAGFVGGLVVGAAGFAMSPRAQFVAGGAMANAAYRLQDHLEAYDFVHLEATAEQVWHEFQEQNALSSRVRQTFPRATRHPVVAMLVCMDARIDVNDLTGDTRRNSYVIRTAGSVISPMEEEMLELAVRNGVKLIVLTRHSDCAAEKAARDPAMRAVFPALVSAIDERDGRIAEFFARPAISERLAAGTLLVKQLDIDTATEHLDERPPAPAAVSPAELDPEPGPQQLK